MPFFFDYFWLIAAVFQAANAGWFWYQCQPISSQRPDLRGAAWKVLWGFYALGCLPWLVIGAGVSFGGMKSVLSILRPSDGDPFVLTFFATVFCLQLLAFYWVVLCGGAEKMSELPDVLRRPFNTPFLLKLFVCFALIMNPVVFVVLWVVKPPVR